MQQHRAATRDRVVRSLGGGRCDKLADPVDAGQQPGGVRRVRKAVPEGQIEHQLPGMMDASSGSV
jgi:hypothetical protein